MKTIIKSILLVTGLAIAAPCTYAQVSVGIAIRARIAPPAIPVYVQPECPVDGYIWTPGYWAWSNDDNDYYWVPGVWVAPPDPGYLWTPPYWAYNDGYYGYYPGYWGLHVGYYGGINYGFGYGGVGFYGGMWSGGRFRYNTAVWRVNSRIHNTYINNNFVRNNNHYSFNCPGGSNARPSRGDALAARDHHIQATSNQRTVQHNAMSNRNQRASINHGRPSVASMNRANGSRLGAEGHAAPAAQHTANRMGATHNAAPQRNAQVQHNQQNNMGARHQAQQQRMQSRPQQQARPQMQQHMQSRPQQQARPQMQQHMQARPMGGGGGGRPMGGGGAPHGGGGGGGHRR